MKPYLHYSITVLVIIIIGVFITNYFITKHVKTVLAEEDYVSFSSLSANAFTGNLGLEDVCFESKTKIIKIDRLNLNLNVTKYVFSNAIEIEIAEADGLDLKIKISPNSKNEFNKQPENLIIKKVKLSNSSLSVEEENTVIFEVSSIELSTEKFEWPTKEDLSWLNDKTLNIKASHLIYDMNALHHLKIREFTLKNKSLTFEDLQILPKFSKDSYTAHIKTEKDLISLETKSFKISEYEISKKNKVDYYKFKTLEIDSTDLTIYRDKTIADDNTYKPLYSEMLRNLNFQLKVDSASVSNLNVTYQELIQKDREVAEIKFNNINGQISNIHNSLETNVPQIKVQAQAQFTKDSEINFNYDLTPKNEQFTVSTSLKEVEDASINKFFGPSMKMELEGNLNDIKTSIEGNHIQMNGDFSIAYKKLKLHVLKKNGSRNNFASLMSNAFIKNKDVNDLHELEDIKRDETKSFWNYIWTFHFEGLKRSLL